jgi:thymidylate synthase (FAD)
VTFKVDAPVFVARQLVKHKFLRWNEVSRRYVDNEPDIYSPDHWRQRPENKKQGSGQAFEKEHQQFMQQQYVEVMDRVLKMYEYMLAYGVAPEQARMMLPQSMMTSWWWSGSLDAFADMCKLRLGPDSQTETREVAIQIAEEMVNLFPVSWKALMEND